MINLTLAVFAMEPFAFSVVGEDGKLEVAGIVAEPDAEAEARAAIDAATGGSLRYRPDLIRHALPTPEEIALLRGFDPARVILG